MKAKKIFIDCGTKLLDRGSIRPDAGGEIDGAVGSGEERVLQDMVLSKYH